MHATLLDSPVRMTLTVLTVLVLGLAAVAVMSATRTSTDPRIHYTQVFSSIPALSGYSFTDQVTFANGICSGLRQGSKEPNLVYATPVVLAEHGVDVTTAQATELVGAAIDAYCPEYHR